MSRHRWSHLVAPALLVAWLPGLAQAQFTVPRDSFYSRLHVVALAPVNAPEDLENPEPVKALFAGLLESRLRAAGFEMAMPDRTRPLWDSIRALQGGLFDPNTGKPDTAKLRRAQAAFCQEVVRRFNADAILFPAIVVTTARVQGSVAAWDGTQQGTAAKKLFHMMLGTWQSGEIGALSLWVDLSAPDGSDLYMNAGGIQVLQKVGPTGKSIPVQRKDLFADAHRNENAVKIALQPLLEPKKP